MSSIEIQHDQEPTNGKFYVGELKQPKAEMTYSRAGDNVIIIDHTEVSDDLRGQGVGEKLVRKAVEYARENHLRIMPLCPFAKSVMEKNEDLQDVRK